MAAPANVPFEFPDVPGLTLEAMTEADLDAASAAIVAAGLRKACDGEHWHPGWIPEIGLVPDPCPGPLGHVRNELAPDLDAVNTWALCLRFQGRPLQFEIVRLDDTPAAATIDLTVQANRERPAWFWREVHCPLVEALAGLGVQRVDYWAALGGGDRPWLADARVASGTRMNSGDSHVNLAATGGAAPAPRPGRSEAYSGLPWWAGSDEPVWSAPAPRTERSDEAAAREPFLTLVPAF